LTALQIGLIGLDFVKTPANFRRFLRRHTPVLVKFDWLVRHNRLPFPACAISTLRSDAPDGLEKM
jgi:hypothetical protein